MRAGVMNVIASWIELTLADGVTFSAEPQAGGAGYVLKNRAFKQVKQLVTATLHSVSLCCNVGSLLQISFCCWMMFHVELVRMLITEFRFIMH